MCRTKLEYQTTLETEGFSLSFEMIEKDTSALFDKISSIIEIRKQRAGAVVNQEVTLMYWEIGKYLSEEILESKRADYGKRIVATLSQQLVLKYGKTFEHSKMA